MKGSNTKDLREIRRRRARINNAFLIATAVEIAICGTITLFAAVAMNGTWGTLILLVTFACWTWVEFFIRANAEWFSKRFARLRRKLFSKKKRTDVQDQSSGRKFIHVDFTSPSYQMARRSVK